MKVNPKKSSYAKMYLVTPGIYEKLKKCIDEYDISELSKLNKTYEVESQSTSNNIIRNISMGEILSSSNANDTSHSINDHGQASASHSIKQPSVSNITNPEIRSQSQTQPLNISRHTTSSNIAPITPRQSIRNHTITLEDIEEENENERNLTQQIGPLTEIINIQLTVQ